MLTGIGAFQRVIGYVLMIGVATFLILAWILTSPLMRWGVFLGDRYRKRFVSDAAEPRFGARMPK